MADISQIRLPNNTVLDIKDATARQNQMSFGFSDDTSSYSLVGKRDNNTLIEASTLKYAYSSTAATLQIGYNVPGRLILGNQNSGESVTLRPATPITTNRTLYLPNKTGTVAITDDIPQPETIANIKSMLTDLGLDADATYSLAYTGTAETNHAIVQEG